MMKQLKTIVITAIITLFTLGAVLYTSCRKDHCKTLNCLHGGACNDGFCLCPTGYTGTYCEQPDIATIGFRNMTFTKVYMTIDGIDYTVDSGTTLTITGGFGDTLKGSASTHGAYGINVPLAPIKVTFPTSSIRYYDLNVDSTFFFLKVINGNSTVPFLSQVYVNYQQRDEKFDVVQIPNDGHVFNVGYYRAYNDTHIHIGHTPNFTDYNSLGLPMTNNQVYILAYN